MLFINTTAVTLRLSLGAPPTESQKLAAIVGNHDVVRELSGLSSAMSFVMLGTGDTNKAEVVGDDQPSLAVHLSGRGSNTVAVRASRHQDSKAIASLNGATPIGATASLATVMVLHVSDIG